MTLFLNLLDTVWNKFTSSNSASLSELEKQDAQLYARVFLILGMLCLLILVAAILMGSREGTLLTLPSIFAICLLLGLSKTRYYYVAPFIAITISIALNWIDITFVSAGTSVWLLGSTIYLASFFYQARALVLWSILAIGGVMVIFFMRGLLIVNPSLLLTSGFMGIVIVNKAMVQRQTRLLKQSEARLRAAIDGGLDGFFLLTQLDETEKFRIIDANVMAGRMVDQALPNLIGARAADKLTLPAFPQDAILQACREAINQQQRIHEELELPDGRWIEYQIVPFERNVALTVRDISQKKETAVQAFQLAVEQERVMLLTNFITGASHEFRTPLSIIETTSYLLMKVADPARRQTYQDRISLQIQRIVLLVERLVLASELETLRKLEKEQLHLTPILQELQQELAELLDEKNVDLQTEEAAVLSRPLPLHKRYFFVAIKEIVANSIRFCPPQQQIQIGAALDGQQAIITIEDTAKPIDAETLPHIFKLFFRKDKAHSTPGFGLGLPIARRVVELHGGQIDVQPQPEVGNIVKISLPLTE